MRTISTVGVSMNGELDLKVCESHVKCVERGSSGWYMPLHGSIFIRIVLEDTERRIFSAMECMRSGRSRSSMIQGG